MYYTRKVKRPSAETNNFYLKLAVWLLAGLILLAVNATFFGPSGLATRPDSNVSFTIDSLNLYSLPVATIVILFDVLFIILFGSWLILGRKKQRSKVLYLP